MTTTFLSYSIPWGSVWAIGVCNTPPALCPPVQWHPPYLHGLFSGFSARMLGGVLSHLLPHYQSWLPLLQGLLTPPHWPSGKWEQVQYHLSCYSLPRFIRVVVRGISNVAQWTDQRHVSLLTHNGFIHNIFCMWFPKCYIKRWACDQG